LPTRRHSRTSIFLVKQPRQPPQTAQRHSQICLANPSKDFVEAHLLDQAKTGLA